MKKIMFTNASVQCISFETKILKLDLTINTGHELRITATANWTLWANLNKHTHTHTHKQEVIKINRRKITVTQIYGKT